MVIKARHRTGRKHKKLWKDKKTRFAKESVENADFYKAALNKIITTHECVEYNFLAPLKVGVFFIIYHNMHIYKLH